MHHAPTTRSARQGFNLLEIMVVIAVIGLLMAVIARPLFAYLEEAQIKAAKMQLRQVAEGLHMCQLAKGRYPTEAEGLAFCGRFLDAEGTPLDPWGNPLGYRYPGQGERWPFGLWSLGTDGEEGGEEGAADLFLEADGA